MCDHTVNLSESPPPPYDPAWRLERNLSGLDGPEEDIELDVLPEVRNYHNCRSPDVVRDLIFLEQPTQSAGPVSSGNYVPAILLEPDRAGEILLSNGNRVNAKHFLDQVCKWW